MTSEELPNDHLDPLLKQWHHQNAQRAAELRDATLQRAATGSNAQPGRGASARMGEPHQARLHVGPRPWLRGSLAAAALIALAVVAAFFLPIGPSSSATACTIAMVPDGGRLHAIDRAGCVLGACPLQHTDVAVDIAGPFTRVTLVQKFGNPYRVPIEAVYTFPLGERGAVDRMRMIVRGPGGERVVDGVVKERTLARFIYESAREQGYVASLLEQERPNIFTQSVANIEPGATVDVEISYIETLAMKDGAYQFSFPMVVGPRYIPGRPGTPPPLPAGWKPRDGVILLGPASFAMGPDADERAKAVANVAHTQQEVASVAFRVESATPVESPGSEQLHALGEPAAVFRVTYADGSQEPGAIYASGAGSVGGRWFIVSVDNSPSGRGFAQDTGQVPDASRITPMPVRPETRAGHDISLSVNIDTGGPAMKDLVSKLHGVDVKFTGSSKCALRLQNGSTIPNKDFILTWSLQGNSVLEGAFTYASIQPATPPREGVQTLGPAPDGFFTLVMTPPPAPTAAQTLPRELVFVLDTSGSMNGWPIEKSKELMQKMLGAMRPEDTFNIVTFAGATAIMWPELRPATPQNLEHARAFVGGLYGSGGTEMMKAIDAALVQMPGTAPAVQPDGTVTVPPRTPISPSDPPDAAADKPAPMRLAVFLTDGYVGNDQGIIAAVQRNAGTTRVFTFGIGNSVNRYLLEEMARHGRGACDIVPLSEDADKAVDLFTRRVQTPLLRDISVAFEGITVTELEPNGALLPDLFDMQPLVVHGRWKIPGTGTVIVRGRTTQGPYERRIPIKLDINENKASMLPQLWARRRVDAILAPHLQAVEQQNLDANIRAQVVALGEEYHLVTPYTSFVAVERSRVIVGGKPMLVTVPIEFPEGLRWEGFFGGASWCNRTVVASVLAAEGAADVVNRVIPSFEGEHEDLVYRSGTVKGDYSLGTRLRESASKSEGGALKSPSRGLSGIDFQSAGQERMARNVRFQPGRPSSGAGGGMGGGGMGSGAASVSPPAPKPGSPSGAAGLAITTAAPAPAAPANPAAAEPAVSTSPTGGADKKVAGDARDDALRNHAAGHVPPVSGGAATHANSVYLVQTGDTLSGISQLTYGTASRWKEILDANVALLHNNELALQPGMKLLIPTPTPAATPAATPAPHPQELPEQVRERLARVLERRLLALALYERLTPEQRAKLPGLPDELVALTQDQGGEPATVQVNVLASAADTETQKPLLAAGLVVSAQAPAPGGKVQLIGRVPVAGLIALAQVPAVHRIEPLQAVPAP